MSEWEIMEAERRAKYAVKRRKAGYISFALKMLIYCTMFSALGWLSVRAYLGLYFTAEVDPHLRRAATAVNLEMALTALNQTNQALDAWGMCLDYKAGAKCYTTAVFTPTPEESIGEWRLKLDAIQQELLEIAAGTPSPETQQRTKIALIRMYQVLLSQGSEGASSVSPGGISAYPNNTLFWWWGLLSGVLFCVFGLGKLLLDEQMKRWW